MLFPNYLDRDNAIRARQTLNLPRSKWAIKAQGPSGRDSILTIVADSPRDLSALGNSKSGPFYTLTTASNGQPDLQWLLHAASHACSHLKPVQARNAKTSCSDAFGSALVDIVEK